MIWLLLLLVAFGAIAVAAVAVAATSKPPEGPFDLALMATYSWVVGIAGIGGLASFHGKVRRGEARWVNISEVLGELVTSSLAGLLTYWLCRATPINEFVAAAMIGVSGHMGSRAMFMLEKALERWLSRWFTPLPNDSTAPQDRK